MVVLSDFSHIFRRYDLALEKTGKPKQISEDPILQIENEHIFQITHNPKWGAEIAAQTGRQMDDYFRRYELKASYRATVADLRKPDMHHLRESDATCKVLESFSECAKQVPHVIAALCRAMAAANSLIVYEYG